MDENDVNEWLDRIDSELDGPEKIALLAGLIEQAFEAELNFRLALERLSPLALAELAQTVEEEEESRNK